MGCDYTKNLLILTDVFWSGRIFFWDRKVLNNKCISSVILIIMQVRKLNKINLRKRNITLNLNLARRFM